MKRKIFISVSIMLLGILFPAGVWAGGLNDKQKITALETVIGTLQGQIIFLTERMEAMEAAIGKLDELTTRVEENETLLQFVKIVEGPINKLKGPNMIIEGCNFHVRNGSGATDDGGNFAGLGNFVIGYNEIPDGLLEKERGGWHNLIIGGKHRFGSYGGLVAGHDNTASAPYASVSGGFNNEASERGASVSGGLFNRAIGLFSSVIGGDYNRASGDYASVSGGSRNSASGYGSSVSGGVGNTATGEGSSVSGGRANTAIGYDSSIVGDNGKVYIDHYVVH